MYDYDTNARHVIERLNFRRRNQTYEGYGVMSWSPADGVCIDAYISEQQATTSTQTISIPAIGFVHPDDIRTLLLQLRPGERAIIPHVPIADELNLVNHRLSVRTPRVIFWERGRPTNMSIWLVTCYFQFESKPITPHNVHEVLTVDGNIFKESYRHDAIYYTDNEGTTIRGRALDETRFIVYCGLPKDRWSKYQAWYWPEAARYSLSFLLGQDVQLLRRDVHFEDRHCTELIKGTTPVNFGPLTPFFGEHHVINIDHFVTLTKFLTTKTTTSEICKRIISQIAYASRESN